MAGDGDVARDDETSFKPLGRCSVVYYGVGHMLNDITSACWFTYLLVFLTDIGLSPRFVTYQLVYFYFNRCILQTRLFFFFLGD